jgi:hypothetical protein
MVMPARRIPRHLVTGRATLPAFSGNRDELLDFVAVFILLMPISVILGLLAGGKDGRRSARRGIGVNWRRPPGWEHPRCAPPLFNGTLQIYFVGLPGWFLAAGRNSPSAARCRRAQAVTVGEIECELRA